MITGNFNVLRFYKVVESISKSISQDSCSIFFIAGFVQEHIRCLQTPLFSLIWVKQKIMLWKIKPVVGFLFFFFQTLRTYTTIFLQTK